MSDNAAAYDPQTTIRRHLRLAIVLIGFLVVGVGGLAAVTGISGAVMGPGRVVVASDVKTIQHPTGGVVTEIRVDDGGRVRAGDVLLALDPTIASANATIVGTAVDQLTARQARLEAERDSRPLRFPESLQSRSADPNVAGVMTDERRLYRLRAEARAGQKQQSLEEIRGFGDQAEAKRQQTDLIEQELVGVRKLYARELVPLTRLNALEREAAALRGDVAQLEASIAGARGRIIQIDQDARSDAGRELTDVQGRLAELTQRKVTADQEYSRILIRAPQDGVVDKLTVHTIGAVIAPGATILTIVPTQDKLGVEAKIRPSDVDRVKAGQTAMLRFSAFNLRSTPELKGSVDRVSAEVHAEDRTGATYYLAHVTIPPDQLARLGGLTLVPGMPVETFIQTGRRSMLSYLIKPLTDQFNRAFRED